MIQTNPRVCQICDRPKALLCSVLVHSWVGSQVCSSHIMPNDLSCTLLTFLVGIVAPSTLHSEQSTKTGCFKCQVYPCPWWHPFCTHNNYQAESMREVLEGEEHHSTRVWRGTPLVVSQRCLRSMKLIFPLTEHFLGCVAPHSAPCWCEEDQ